MESQLTDAHDTLCQSQKCHDRPFLSNLPGLQWVKADNYPLRNREKDVSNLAISS
jgi:hypothetical protein